jgi:dolichol kinase
MAKTRSQGPVLSQRERRKDAQDLKLKAGHEEFEEEDKKKPTVEPFPQEKFIMWASKMFQDHFTAGKFIQLSILAFAVNQAYVAFDDTYTTESDTNLLISTLCGLVALIAGVVIAFRVKANLRKQRGEEIPVALPPWNTVYLIFLPIMLPYVFQRELMLYNAAFASSVLELPLVAKVIIQTTIIGSNTEHDDMVANLKIVLTHTAINYVLGKVSEFKSLDRVEVTLFSTLLTDLYLIESEELYIVLLQKLFTSYCLGLGVVYGITKLWTSNTLLRSLIVLIAWTASFTTASLYQLEPVFNENAVVWLYDYILSSETRVQIFSVWLVSLLLLIPTIFNYKIRLSTNSRRKIWHFLVLILIAYPLRLDPDFVKLSLSGSLILFFVVEMIRYLKLAPFGQVLDSHLREFADWRDEKGPIIISYIYLFIGITLPILFNNSVVGLVVLGVGDSMASIVGSKWGEIKWSRSEKTVEGTMTFVVSTFAICSLFKWISWYFVDKSYHSLLLTCTLSGLLEGNSDMNDNIMIPGYMLVLLQSLE